MKRFSILLLMVGMMAPVAYGDTVVVDDDFEAYDDYGAGTNLLHDTWVATGDAGLYGLADNSTTPDAFPTAQGGSQGAGHVGGAVAVWNSTSALGNVAPSANQKVVLSFDVYDDGSSANRRLTVGLRQTAGVANLFELGYYNVASAVTYSARMIGFPGTVYPAHHDPANSGWFGITDLVDDLGDPITPPAGGQNSAVVGWHTMKAEFFTDHVDISLDLNRDGNINAVNTVPFTAFHTDNGGGFHQLRFGSPSSISNPAGQLIVDNMYLALEDFVAPGLTGDHNGDGTVDAADYALWRSDPSSHNDAQGYTDWVDQFGQTGGSAPAVGLSAAAVPEPAALVLMLLGAVALAAGRRGR